MRQHTNFRHASTSGTVHALQLHLLTYGYNLDQREDTPIDASGQFNTHFLVYFDTDTGHNNG